MANDDDRRHAERVPVNDEFHRLGGEGVAYVSNLSVTGVLVHTQERLPLGSKIELRFTVLLDDPVLIEASGEVVRHQTGDDPGMGVRFGPLSPIMVLRIQDAIARRRPRDSGAPVGGPGPVPMMTLDGEVTGVFRRVEDDPHATRPLPVLEGVAAIDDDGPEDDPDNA